MVPEEEDFGGLGMEDLPNCTDCNLRMEGKFYKEKHLLQG